MAGPCAHLRAGPPRKPSQLRPSAGATTAAALLRDEPELRCRLGQARDDQSLALQVELGHQIAARLFGRRRPRAVAAEQERARFGRYLEREARIAVWAQLTPWHFLYFLPL